MWSADEYEDAAREMRRESCDYRHVARRRRAHRAERFRPFLRVTWEQGRRIIVARNSRYVWRLN